VLDVLVGRFAEVLVAVEPVVAAESDVADAVKLVVAAEVPLEEDDPVGPDEVVDPDVVAPEVAVPLVALLVLDSVVVGSLVVGVVGAAATTIVTDPGPPGPDEPPSLSVAAKVALKPPTAVYVWVTGGSAGPVTVSTAEPSPQSMV
jgi:hypothetical protein